MPDCGQSAGKAKETLESSQTSTRTPRVNRTELAYIAGILDGEGSITGSALSYRVQVRLAIHNSNIELLNWINERFDGHITDVTSGSPLTKRTCYVWVPYGHTIDRFLKLIYPFMRIKKKQARLMQVYRSMGRGKTERKANVVRQIQSLNRGEDTVDAN